MVTGQQHVTHTVAIIMKIIYKNNNKRVPNATKF